MTRHIALPDGYADAMRRVADHVALYAMSQTERSRIADKLRALAKQYEGTAE